MKITPIPKFTTPYGAIEFLPVENTPGYTHRVAVNGVWTKFWVPRAQKVNRAAAVFYIRMWAAERDGLDKHHYIDKNIDPPLTKPEAAPRPPCALHTEARAGV